MSGTLLQIYSVDSKNYYMTYNPTFTFFRASFTDTIDKYFLSNSNYEDTNDKINFGKTKIFIIEYNSDMIHKIMLKITLPKVSLPQYGKFAWTKRIGFALIDKLDFIVNDKIISSQNSIWMDIQSQLSDETFTYNLITNDQLTEYSSKDKNETTLFIPLNFWFNKYIEIAFPYISINSKIKFQLKLSPIENLIIRNEFITGKFLSELSIQNCCFIVENTNIKSKSAKNKYKFVEQIIENSVISLPETVDTINNYVKLDFTKPIKELFWTTINKSWKNNIFLGFTNNKNWSDELNDISVRLLKRSIIVSSENELVLSGSWTKFIFGATSATPNGKINIVNNSLTHNLFINTSSLIVKSINFIDKISATITISLMNVVTITDFSHTLLIKDISLPLSNSTDTRVPLSSFIDEQKMELSDVRCNLFSNYSCFIDGSVQPLKSSELIIDNVSRISKFDSEYFNYYIPNIYYDGIPDTGIYVYSFTPTPNTYLFSKNADYYAYNNSFDNSSILLNYELDENVIQENTYIHIFATTFEALRIENGNLKFAYVVK